MVLRNPLYICNKLLLVFFYISFVLTSCTHKKSTLAQIQSDPTNVVDAWLKALSDKDVDVLFDLIQPESWNNIEQNIDLYLQTIQDLNIKDHQEINKMLQLHGKKLLQSFMKWEGSIVNAKKFDYTVSEMKIGHDTSSAKVLVVDQVYTISLIKNNNLWYIQTNNINIPDSQPINISNPTRLNTDSRAVVNKK